MKIIKHMATCILTLCVFQVSLYGQSKFAIPFHQLSCLDSLKIDDPKVVKLKEKAINAGNSYFITSVSDSLDTHPNPEKIWIKSSVANNKYYRAYDLDFVNKSIMSNAIYGYHYWLDTNLSNKEYLFMLTGFHFRSGVGTQFAQNLTVIAINSVASINIPANNTYYYNVTAKSDSLGIPNDITFSKTSLDSTFISFSKNILTLKAFHKWDEGEEFFADIISSGAYKFKDGVLIKVKEYNAASDSFVDVKYFANVALGMNKRNIEAIYPNAVFTETNADKYGDTHDNNKVGFEITVDSEMLMFIYLKNDICTEIYGISKKHGMGNISTNTTIEEILKLYPNTKLHIDLVSDLEYVYIDELDIKLYFSTNEKNRVGIYNDP